MSTRLLALLLLLAVPAEAQKTTYDEFARALEQTTRLGDQKGYEKAIRENPVHCITHYKGLVFGSLRDPDDLENANKRKAMRDAWTVVFEGAMLARLDRWLQSLDLTARRNYENLVGALTQGYGEYARFKRENVTARESHDKLIESLTKIAEAFEAIGDGLNAADTWGLMSTVYANIPEQTVRDRKDAVYAMGRFREHRQTWEWITDSFYLRNMNWMDAEREKIKVEEAALEKRKAEGYSENVRGVDVFLLANADEVEKTSPLTFKVLSRPKLDMCLQGGPVPMMWASVNVEGEGPSRFAWFKGGEIFMVRPGSNKFGVTLDGVEKDLKKNDFEQVSASNKIRGPSKFFLDADQRRPYAMWFFVGGSQESFQGIAQNLEPQRERATVYYKSAGSWVADIDGTPVTFFDDNSNGRLFEEDAFAYGLGDRNIGAGPDEEVHLPAYDAMQIGKEPVQPLSSWVSVGGQWYHLRGKDDGKGVGLRPVNPEYFKTGTVQLKWNGPRSAKLQSLIIEGMGDFHDGRFNIASGKPIEVPVGKYKLVHGHIEQGRGARLMTANVFGGSSEPITVEEGKSTEMTIGAPFRIDFTREEDEGTVVINALKMRVRGSAGEIYARINGAPPVPVVLAAKSDDGKGAKEVGEFMAIPDADMAGRVAQKFKDLGIHCGFYPIIKGDNSANPILKVKVPAGYKVGLQQDKNKLLGKLEPIWK